MPFNKTLAEAIIDMDNIGFSEGLEPKTKEKRKEWKKLIRSVAKEYNLQHLIHDPELRK